MSARRLPARGAPPLKMSAHSWGAGIAGAAILLAFALNPDAAAAQAPAGRAAPPPEVIEAQTKQLARELRCPVCQGMSVEDSPTDLSNQMKAVIREQLRAGKSPDEVKAYFVERYGEWILLRPPARGVNLLVYVLPWLALLAGATVIWVAFRRWRRSAPDDAGAEGDARPATS